MLSIKLWLCAPIFLSSIVVSMYSNRTVEGLVNGYLPDCPGVDNPVKITPFSLKFMTITVRGLKGNWPIDTGKSYSYYQTKELARDPTMDFSKKILMYVGGIKDIENSPLSIPVTNHYLKAGYNVWIINFNRFTTFYYPTAARVAREAGKRAGEMLANVAAKNTGFDPKKFEMAGLGLGGQLMSFIAKSYKEITGQKLSRMTGLDPAGPCFRHLGPEGRLDESDADRVDVLSTNIDGFGMAAPVGHVNFYVNGGEFQPADIAMAPCNVMCSHAKAFAYWLAILENPHSFIALQCDSVQQARDKKCYNRVPLVTNLAGFNTDFSKPGIFYLPTLHHFPYYMEKKGLKKSSESFYIILKEMNEEDVMVV